jgi:AbrB family looped-hinge helix DNA binding protein
MTHVIHTKLGKGRRVVIPAEACQQFGIEPGDSIVVSVEDEQIVVKPLKQVIKDVQAFFSQFRQGDTTWTDELIQDRREEAAREGND